MRTKNLTASLLFCTVTLVASLLPGLRAYAQSAVQAAALPSPADYISKAEQAVVAELSLARTNPVAYAKFLEATLPYYQDKYFREPNQITIVTEEGKKAVLEAIAFLKKQAPVGALTASKGLSLAARDHVKDTGPSGIIGHTGKDGSTLVQRINRYGKWQGSCAENIDYGNDDARKIVISLIVDDGVSSRGHRTNIFAPTSTRVGVAIGPHKVYRNMCVMDFAGGYIDK